MISHALQNDVPDFPIEHGESEYFQLGSGSLPIVPAFFCCPPTLIGTVEASNAGTAQEICAVRAVGVMTHG